VSLALFALLLAPPAPAPVMFTSEEIGRVGEAFHLPLDVTTENPRRLWGIRGKEMVLGRR
jgi:hypothetical protein